jgi:hypothetical protein
VRGEMKYSFEIAENPEKGKIVNLSPAFFA